jgi:hypothetical protein
MQITQKTGMIEERKYSKLTSTEKVPAPSMYLSWDTPFVLVSLHVLTCCVCFVDTMVNLRELLWISLCNFIL